MKIFEELSFKVGTARALHGLAMIHQGQGRYDDAMEMYQKSLKICNESGDKMETAKILHQLGMIHQHQGRYDDAVKSYQNSMKIKKELGDRAGIAITLGQMGRIFIFQKNYKEALKSSLFAFLIFNEIKSPYKDMAGKDIMKLKKEIGEELFNKYYQEITSDEQREKDNN